MRPAKYFFEVHALEKVIERSQRLRRRLLRRAPGRGPSDRKLQSPLQVPDLDLLRPGGVLAVQGPGEGPLALHGDAGGVAEDDPRPLEVPQEQASYEVLELHAIGGGGDEQELEAPVVQHHLVLLELHEAPHGGGVGHRAEEELPVEGLLLRGDEGPVGAEVGEVPHPLQHVGEVAQVVFHRLGRAVGHPGEGPEGGHVDKGAAVEGPHVQGAALATVISQAISGVWVVRFLTGKRTTLRLRRGSLRPSWALMAPVLALGVSPFVMQSTEALLSISFNSSLQRYGGDIAVGAMTIANTVLQMVWIPSQGLGQGAQPIISYNYGAKNAKRVKDAFFALLKVSCALMLTFWLLVQLFPQVFIRIFNNNPLLMDTAKWTLRLYTAVLGMFGIQMSVQQTLMAIGKAKASLFIACLRKIILLIPLIFLLPQFFENKVFAVFLAEPVSDFISVTAAAITFFLVFRPALAELEADQSKAE